jgi:hypothetical protein
MDREKLAKESLERSQRYRTYFDAQTGFMRGRKQDRSWIEPFTPTDSDHKGGEYVEGNAWQWTWFVPHDVPGLIELFGGHDPFAKKLDQLFTTDSKITGKRISGDITGLIGQYAHGNEPSHHTAFLYNFIGKPEKTKALVDRICKEQYHNTPDGLCGNEDCGQMSAWYVFAKNNVYPFLPGKNNMLSIDNTARFPSKPIIASRVTDFLIQPMPIISGPQLPFRDSTQITISAMKGAGNYIVHIEPPRGSRRPVKVLDLLDGETKRITIYDETHVVAFSKTTEEKLCTADFYRRDSNRKMVSLTPYNNQYTGGGDEALIDGMRGGADFRTGSWQGWQGQNVECVIDLGSEQAISSIGLSCLQETKSWIWFPSRIEFMLSHDGKSFASAGFIDITEYQKETNPSTREFKRDLRGSARFVKIIAKPAFDKIPNWHLGAGGTPWIFVDEILVN